MLPHLPGVGALQTACIAPYESSEGNDVGEDVLWETSDLGEEGGVTHPPKVGLPKASGEGAAPCPKSVCDVSLERSAVAACLLERHL